MYSHLKPLQTNGIFHLKATYTINTAGNPLTSKQQQWRIPLKNPVDSGTTFIDISVNTGQIGMWFEADTLKNDSKLFNVRQRTG